MVTDAWATNPGVRAVREWLVTTLPMTSELGSVSSSPIPVRRRVVNSPIDITVPSRPATWTNSPGR